MTRHSALPITFAGFPVYDDAAAGDAQIAIIGVPYLSPYPVEKSYDSQNAVAAIRQASLTYQKIDHMTSLFAARQILNFMGVVAHSSQFSER
jgi:hypothetical protein